MFTTMSYSSDPFVRLEERSSTSVCALSVCSRTIWWSAIILINKGKIYLVEEMWNHLDFIPHSFFCFKKYLFYKIKLKLKQKVLKLIYIIVINVFSVALYSVLYKLMNVQYIIVIFYLFIFNFWKLRGPLFHSALLTSILFTRF